MESKINLLVYVYNLAIDDVCTYGITWDTDILGTEYEYFKETDIRKKYIDVLRNSSLLCCTDADDIKIIKVERLCDIISVENEQGEPYETNRDRS
jgi:hypothetical protein